MEVVIVFLVIVAVSVLIWWALSQAGVPPIVPIIVLVVGLLIALLYLAGNADEIDLDDDNGSRGLVQVF